MKLRVKLVIVHGSVVLGCAVLSLLFLEAHARKALRQAAEQRLHEVTHLLAERGQKRIDLELKKLESWAAMPLVVETALDDCNPELVQVFMEYFQDVVERENRYSVYMFSRDGECVASDDSRRIYAAQARDVISRRPGLKKAFEGNAVVGESTFSIAAARPLLPLSVPVWSGREVVAVLRTSVDMTLLQRDLFSSVQIGKRGHVYIDDPELDKKLPPDWELLVPDIEPQWTPPPESVVHALKTAPGGVCYYEGEEGRYLLASSRIGQLPWMVIATQPLEEVLEPLHALRRAMLVTVIALGVILLCATFGLIAPVVRGIEKCQALASEYQRGHLHKRLDLSRSDEIGALAQGLNDMAQSIDRSRRVIIEAEKKYRALFENAAEGIFMTSADGTILTANPALASILGASSLDSLIGISSLDFYPDREVRARLTKMLFEQGRIDWETVELVRFDGTRCRCAISARVERNAEGDVQRVQGLMVDVTARHNAEVARERLRETERLLADARWQALRYQLNPHFLFNVLTSVEALSREAPKKIPGLMRHLAAYLRLTLEPHDDPLVPIERELEAVQAYLDIEKVRFEEQLEVAIDWDPAVQEVCIPDLLFQPLIENSIKYGMQNSSMPLKISIRIQKFDERIEIAVGNSGCWIEPGSAGREAGVGLSNLRSRLELLYKQAFDFKTEERDGWVWVLVRIPVEPCFRDEVATSREAQWEGGTG